MSGRFKAGRNREREREREREGGREREGSRGGKKRKGNHTRIMSLLLLQREENLSQYFNRSIKELP